MLPLPRPVRIGIALALIASPWAAHAAQLLAGFADGLLFTGLVLFGFVLLAAELAPGRRQPGYVATRRLAAAHVAAVLALSALFLMVTLRATGQA